MKCEDLSHIAKYKNRKSPPGNANSPGCRGVVAQGNDKKFYQSVRRSDGIYTWKKITSSPSVKTVKNLVISRRKPVFVVEPSFDFEFVLDRAPRHYTKQYVVSGRSKLSRARAEVNAAIKARQERRGRDLRSHKTGSSEKAAARDRARKWAVAQGYDVRGDGL